MFVEHKFYVGLREIGKDNLLSNKGILAALEDAGCKHSEMAGLGITNINETKRSWVILSWRVKVLSRPEFNTTLTVKTWSRKMDKLYAYRDYNILDENNNIIALASSKWVLIDYENGKIVKLSYKISDDFKLENKSAFDDENEIELNINYKIKNRICYKITKAQIDLNHHLNNINYLDLAKEILTESIDSYNELQVLYKKQIMLGEEMYIYNCESKDAKYIVITDQEDDLDLKKARAIIKLN